MSERRISSILERLEALANPANVAGMARFGINPQGALGIPIPVLRQIAREIGKDHALALELWACGIHEARILAAYVDNPQQVDEQQMEAWVAEIDSWDVCDQVCSNLFDRTPYAINKAMQWSQREETFVRRTGFVLMAALAVHEKTLPDGQFLVFLELVEQRADDERNFVKKAVNWALRQIGKRNRRLNQEAIEVASRLMQSASRTARWIGSDAHRELTSEKIQKKLPV